jgi:putative ABC transport system permease protein
MARGDSISLSWTIRGGASSFSSNASAGGLGSSGATSSEPTTTGYVLDAYVGAFVPFWPSLNPQERVGPRQTHFVVMNLAYFQAMTDYEAYEAWIRRDRAVPDIAFYGGVLKSSIPLTGVQDARWEIDTEKERPAMKGINGVLTVAFFVVLVVSFTGFLLCWIIAMGARVLEFGVIRAMGMGVRSVVAMMVAEHLIISASAFAGGVGIGGLASRLFLPLLQVSTNLGEQVPPYQIGAFVTDYVILFALVVAMLASALAVLAVFLGRLRISQAVKLGED